MLAAAWSKAATWDALTPVELPIEPQVVGEHIKLGKNQHVKLLGPEKLELRIQEANG